MVSRRSILSAVPAALAFLAGCSTPANSTHNTKFDLDKWRLQLPVNNDGKLSGAMRTISPARTFKPWFEATSDQLKFVCPAVGATSPNSTSPRTELAESTKWFLEKGGTMAATVKITRMPVNSKMTIGQVFHDDQLLRLRYWADGSIEVAGSRITSQIVGKIPVGTTFSYFVDVKGTTLTLKINGTTVFTRSVSQWAGQLLYFKAGAYCHADAGTDPKAQFKATFTELKISH